jgi:PAS domain S-box-containing protein
MDMENKIRLKRLLHPGQVATLLKDFVSLLGPQVSLAVSDTPDRLLGSHRPLSPEVVHALWEAAPEATQVVVTSQGAATPICVGAQQVGLILATGPLPPPPETQTVLTALRHALESLAGVALERRAVAREALDRYQELNLLYNIGETLATCLNVDDLLQRALTEATQIIQARRGAILLYDETGELVVAASTGMTEELETFIAEGHTLAEEVARTGKPQIVNGFDLMENRVGGEQQTPLLAVPLLTSERKLGTIVLAGKAGAEPSVSVSVSVFTAGDEKLLSALAWQAAIALENARLFDDVRQQRDEIATMKRYMDNIFASITSGVITTDNHDVITTFNRAAETILCIPIHQAVNRLYHQALDFLCRTPLPTLIDDVRQQRKSYVAQEIRPRLPHGEQLYLNLSISTLQGSEGEILGVAIVMDDVTEKHHYERERALVRHYLPSGLVDRLPDDTAEFGLHEERRVITTLFADIQGFSGFSEANPPERVIEVLNNYMTLSGAAVRFNWGIVDKYMGDAVMALFNTPLLERKDHAWRAVRMAWTLKEAVEAYHHYIAPAERLSLGFGVCTGVVVVGNVGTEDRKEYTAVGDTVNVAKRLQENTQSGQILISHETWKMVRERVKVNALPSMRVKGRKAYTRVYELVGLVDVGW